MLDADLVPEDCFPDPMDLDDLPDPDCLTPVQRMESIASILGIAVLRHKYRARHCKAHVDLDY